MASSSNKDSRIFGDSSKKDGNTPVKNMERNHIGESTGASGRSEQPEASSSTHLAGTFRPTRSYAAALSGKNINMIGESFPQLSVQKEFENEVSSSKQEVHSAAPGKGTGQSITSSKETTSHRHKEFRNRNHRRNQNFGSRFTGNFTRANYLGNNGFPTQTVNPYQNSGNAYVGSHYTPSYHAPTTEFSSPRFQHNSLGYLQCNEDSVYPGNFPYRRNSMMGQEQLNYSLMQQQQWQGTTACQSSYGSFPANSSMYVNPQSCTSPSYSHLAAGIEPSYNIYEPRNANYNGYSQNTVNNDLVCPPVNIQVLSPRSGVPILVPYPNQASHLDATSSPGPALVRRFTPAYMEPEDVKDMKELGIKHQAPVPFDTWSSAMVLMEQRRKLKEKVGLVINNRYHVVQKISVGCYGDVFSALDTADPNRRMVAIKFEVKQDESHFKHEKEFYRIYTASSGRHPFPLGIGEVYWTGVQFDYKIVVMELLGPTLERLFNYCNRRFLKQTIHQLGMQFISRLEQVHNRGFVHRDLKPENFLMGTWSNESVCYLIDFGLSRRYRILDEDGTLRHIKLRKRKHIIGTAKYCSILSHWGVELSRRDDMESLGYILIEFITGNLPWKDSRFRDRSDGYGKIRQCKEHTDWGFVCPAMKTWIQYSRSLQYTEKPDYDRFRSFLDEFLMNNFTKVKLKFQERNKEEQSFSSLTDLKSLISIADGYHEGDLFEGSILEEEPSQEEMDEKVLPQSENVNCPSFSYQFGEMNRDKGVDHGYIFEWQARKASNANEKYTYDCLFSWLLPYGVYPQAPEGVCSNVFSYLPGCGGFA